MENWLLSNSCLKNFKDKKEKGHLKKSGANANDEVSAKQSTTSMVLLLSALEDSHANMSFH